MYTMNRCLLFSRPLALALCTAIVCLGIPAWPRAANAQTDTQPMGRAFPRTALRATLVVTAPPEVLLDGKATRLSPGARIRDANNMLVMSGNLVGQRLLVNFTLENNGLVHEVWVLTPTEATQKQAHATPARNFLFNSEIDTTPRDDGKTPFNQLPKFPQH
jgi:hypothetical protein